MKGLVEEYSKFRKEFYEEAGKRDDMPVMMNDEFIATMYLVYLIKGGSKSECCRQDEVQVPNSKGVSKKAGETVSK